jgi:hypothetical protein
VGIASWPGFISGSGFRGVLEGVFIRGMVL